MSRINRVLSFAVTTAIYMVVTGLIPGWWKPVTSPEMDWLERVFFFGFGVWSASK